MKYNSIRGAERGSVLVISLIMLVVLTLLAVSAIKMSTMSLRALNGAQSRSESQWAIQNAIDRIINSNFAADIGAVAGSYAIPIDAAKSYSVTIDPPCLKQLRMILNSELSTTDPEDLKCYDTTSNPYSACSSTVWQLRGSTSDGFFGANVSMVQGVGIRMDSTSAMAYLNSTSPVFTCP